MVMFAGLHLLGLAMVAVLLIMFVRSDTESAPSPPDDGDDGGSGNDRLQPRRLRLAGPGYVAILRWRTTRRQRRLETRS